MAQADRRTGSGWGRERPPHRERDQPSRERRDPLAHDRQPHDAALTDSLGTFAQRVRAVIRGLRPGEVVTYGEVAAEAGAPGSARGVGRLLSTDAGNDLPWWRVVTSTGRLVPGHERRHARRLRAEGVKVTGDRVDRFRR